ncbi:MAG TPA: hypothetical protein VFC07_04930, partial [Verrucomicrobiae bacterium]|nr:hypothetical protein [Verrucomicrobiae bacterium]
ATSGSYNATAALNSTTTWLMQVATFKADPAANVVAPQIIGLTFSSSNAVVKFSTVSGQTYALEGATNPAGNVWAPLVTNIPGTGGIVQIIDTNTAGQRAKFYRVKTPN